MTAERLGYRPELDGIRALAAMAVVFVHVGIGPTVGAGWAVDVFFTLSGFLITYLLMTEHLVTGRVDLLGFWGRRVRRLLPCLVAVVAVCAVLGRLVGVEWGDVLAAGSYTANWQRAGGADLGALGHTWSLSIEEQFYLAWPLLLLALLRQGPRFAMWACVAGAVGVAVAREMVPWPEVRIDNGTDMRADLLLWGCALGIAYTTGKLPRWVGSARVQAVALAAMAAVYGLHVSLDYASRSVIAVATCSVVAGIVTGRTAAVLGAAPLRWVGQRSYGLYLWHFPIAAVLESWWTVPASLLVAGVSYRWIEAPWRDRSWQRVHDDLPVRVGAVEGAVVGSVLSFEGGGARREAGVHVAERRLHAAVRPDAR